MVIINFFKQECCIPVGNVSCTDDTLTEFEVIDVITDENDCSDIPVLGIAGVVVKRVFILVVVVLLMVGMIEMEVVLSGVLVL